MTSTTQCSGAATRLDGHLLIALNQSEVAAAMTDARGAITWLNAAFARLTGDPEDSLLGLSVGHLRGTARAAAFYAAIQTALETGVSWSGRVALARPSGADCTLRGVAAPVRNTDGTLAGYSIFAWDATEEARLEAQLAQLHKMEAIGELAAGIAHEINTPIQYIGDNLQFLRSSVGQLFQLMDSLADACETGRRGPIPEEQLEALQQLRETLDLEFLREEVPLSVEQALEGRDRVAAIVRAMKEFAHPGDEALAPVDVNHAIENTLAVSRGEWKHIADIVLELDPAIPSAPCFPGSFNQVLLNLVVNAAHAIAEKQASSPGEKGAITVTTRANDTTVEVRIRDTGCGIPPENIHRIFHPFYTTKDVGKGTGQGLALTHAVIVDKLKGRIEVDSTPGVGTQFTLHLPISPSASDGAG